MDDLDTEKRSYSQVDQSSSLTHTSLNPMDSVHQSKVELLKEIIKIVTEVKN